MFFIFKIFWDYPFIVLEMTGHGYVGGFVWPIPSSVSNPRLSPREFACGPLHRLKPFNPAPTDRCFLFVLGEAHTVLASPSPSENDPPQWWRFWRLISCIWFRIGVAHHFHTDIVVRVRFGKDILNPELEPKQSLHSLYCSSSLFGIYFGLPSLWCKVSMRYLSNRLKIMWD